MGLPPTACRETVRLIKRLHQYDVMRANKAPFAFGLEPRVPFLDKEFLDVSMTLDPADKMVPPLPAMSPVCMAYVSPAKAQCMETFWPEALDTWSSEIRVLEPSMPHVLSMIEVDMMVSCLHG